MQLYRNLSKIDSGFRADALEQIHAGGMMVAFSNCLL